MYDAKARHRRALAVIKLGSKCALCASDDRLEFDHVDPASKKYRPRELWDSYPKYLEEIDKLQLLCHTCHRAKTVQEQTKPLVHGTTNAYNRKKCRCQVCRDFMAARNRKYREARKNK